MPGSRPTAWTIGHSTLPIDAFLALLARNRIAALADVRRFPSSRKYPHFNAPALTDALRDAGIAYLPFPQLGGRRNPRPDSHNTAWRNASFRGYADYMETPAFQAAMEALTHSMMRERTAVMCAESLWWRCHRSLIADRLKSRGWDVEHILQPGGETEEHPYTPAASIVDGALSYAKR